MESSILPPVIETRGLSKSFKDVLALNSLDLEVPERSIVGFLGPNGKTTTIRLLLGLNRPTAGSGKIFGRDIVQGNLEIRRRIGYLAQSPRSNGAKLNEAVKASQ
jgi:ABC-type multidrug transport system ATPase subunit